MPAFLSTATEEVGSALLPGLLVGPLAATPAALGVIEGVALAVGAVLRAVGAGLAHQPARRHRASVAGVAGVAVFTAALAAVGSAFQAGVSRAAALGSRGLDVPASFTAIAAGSAQAGLGRAYGRDRATEHLGAAAGAVLAEVLLLTAGVRGALALAVIPGLLAVYLAFRSRPAIDDLPDPPEVQLREATRLVFRGRLGLAFGGITALEFANIAFTLLILRATALLGKEFSFDDAVAIAVALFIGYRIAAVVASLAAGALIDRGGSLPVLIAGALSLLAAYAIFAFAQNGAIAPLGAAFVLAGAGVGMAETAEFTAVARLSPGSAIAPAFGLLTVVQGAGRPVASVIAGLLWTLVSPQAGLFFTAPLLVGAALLLGVALLRRRMRPG